MTTANELVTDILLEIQLAAAEQPIEAVDAQTVIRYTNRFMAALAVNGISLGWTDITNLNDTITVPAGAEEGIIFNVAKRLLNTYDIPLTQELQMAAADGMKTLEKLGVTLGAMSYPATLPIGSGNEGSTVGSWDHYYDGDDEPVGTEDNKIVGIE